MEPRDYMRNMRRRRPDQEHRFEYLNTWATDGIRVFRHIVDTTRKPPTEAARFQGRLPDIENKLAEIKDETGYFDAIVGIDLRHVFPAAAFSLPTDRALPGAQLKISNNSLYGRQLRLEQRKVTKGVAYLEEEL